MLSVSKYVDEMEGEKKSNAKRAAEAVNEEDTEEVEEETVIDEKNEEVAVEALKTAAKQNGKRKPNTNAIRSMKNRLPKW